MMELPVKLDNSGFTLIEFLVSIVILMVGLLGLLQAVNISYSHNLQTQLRNEAVTVADSVMAAEIARGYDNASTSTSAINVNRKILNGMKNYSVVRTGSLLQNSKEITYEVSWKYKGTRYTHNASGVISKTNQ